MDINKWAAPLLFLASRVLSVSMVKSLRPHAGEIAPASHWSIHTGAGFWLADEQEPRLTQIETIVKSDTDKYACSETRLSWVIIRQKKLNEQVVLLKTV